MKSVKIMMYSLAIILLVSGKGWSAMDDDVIYWVMPSVYMDGLQIVPCDENGMPARCVKQYMLYFSQTSFMEVSEPPQVEADIFDGHRTSWCTFNIDKTKTIYATLRIVHFDGGVTDLSPVSYWLPGNIIGRDYSGFDSAVVDGLDLIFLRRSFGLQVNPVLLHPEMCPQHSGQDLNFTEETNEQAADLNMDGVIDGLDLIILRRVYFGEATQ